MLDTGRSGFMACSLRQMTRFCPPAIAIHYYRNVLRNVLFFCHFDFLSATIAK
jgi:hypothetical protein